MIIEYGFVNISRSWSLIHYLLQTGLGFHVLPLTLLPILAWSMTPWSAPLFHVNVLLGDWVAVLIYRLLNGTYSWSSSTKSTCYKIFSIGLLNEMIISHVNMVTIEFFLPLLSSVFGTRKSEFMFTLNEILNCIPNASSQGFFGFTFNMSY